MDIKIKKLTLDNFKGIKSLLVVFGDITNIFGDNATGKTTINDAFRWLLFDKDSDDRKDFDIKTIDPKTDEAIHGLNHVVRGVLVVDGVERAFEKTYKEKWVKKQGGTEKLFSGHETLYTIDDVPKKKSEYSAAISELLDEEMFKILTDPFCFSDKIKWDVRREILFDLSENLDGNFFTENNEQKEKLKFQKKKLNDSIKSIPDRIDELSRAIVVVDVETLEAELESYQENAVAIDKQLQGLSDPFTVEKAVLKEKLYELTKLCAVITKAHKEAIDNAEDRSVEEGRVRSRMSNVINGTTEEIADNTKTLGAIENHVDELKNEYKILVETKFVFNESSSKCPTCEREFPTADVDGMKVALLEAFNQTQAIGKEDINVRGRSYKSKKDITESKLAGLHKELAELDAQIKEQDKVVEKWVNEYNLIKDTVADIHSPIELKALREEIEMLEDKISTTDNSVKIEELSTDKVVLNQSIDEIRVKLAKAEANKSSKVRIKELEAEESKLAQQIADVEKELFGIEKKIVETVNSISAEINSKFNYVTFKLFDVQINGGITETCEALINGVPFKSANHGSKVNAGLDIINTLSKHYGASAPIVIDNSESITKLIDTEAQMIRLVVSEQDKELRVA